MKSFVSLTLLLVVALPKSLALYGFLKYVLRQAVIATVASGFLGGRDGDAGREW